MALNAAFYHGGEPVRVIRPFLEGEASKPFLLAMTAAGQSALNIRGLDTVVIYDARYGNLVQGGRNILTRLYLGANEILQMAGRVHGRVPKGEVYILTDRDIDFAALRPTPPEFQLAGDAERVALTAAALGIDLGVLDLPVPLDRRSYRESVRRLEDRGIIASGRLTNYGRDVEAMPVERPWGELLVHADPELVPLVAVAANIESLHRMTRDNRDLRGLVVSGSDHLTAYNVYAEAVRNFGYVGEVYGLPRHLFREELEEWAEGRGVLVKAIEDVALGTASVYRTLELPLPERLPQAGSQPTRAFRDLVARIMPFDLVIDEHTADGRPARVSRGSVCGAWGAVAGSIRYFSDARGVARAAIEGTSVPLELIRRYARRGQPSVEFRDDRRYVGLVVSRRTEYFGFELDQARTPLEGTFPAELADQARDALARAVQDDLTPHPDQRRVSRALHRLDEYWRRSGGRLKEVSPERRFELVRQQLYGIQSWADFVERHLTVDPEAVVPSDARSELDALPNSASVAGDRVALDYEIENGSAVAVLHLREGQARRLKERELPALDRPLRFAISHGRSVYRAESVDEVLRAIRSLPRAEGQKRGRRDHRSRHRRR